MSDSDRETQAEINQLEQEIDDLRREYEQFFNDNRDYPPTNKRKQVEQQLRELKRSRLPETRMDFKVRSLDQRFTTLKSKWDRIEQKIERGTYQPHVERANDRVGDGRDDQDRSDNQENDRDVTGQPRDGKWDVDTDAARGDLEKMAQRLEEMNQEGQLDKYAGDGNDSADETADARSTGGASSPARRPGPSGSSDRAEASTDSGGRASSASGGDGSNLDSVRDNLDRSDESGGDEDPVEKLEALDQALEEQSSAEDSSRSGTGND